VDRKTKDYPWNVITSDDQIWLVLFCAIRNVVVVKLIGFLLPFLQESVTNLGRDRMSLIEVSRVASWFRRHIVVRINLRRWLLPFLNLRSSLIMNSLMEAMIVVIPVVLYNGLISFPLDLVRGTCKLLLKLRYGLHDWGSRVRFPVGLGIFPFTTERLWGQPSLLSNGYQGLFPWG
jgi:hypothetical protein